MLEKVLKLDQIGPFAGVVWPDSEFKFNVVNILYGFNGSGKTVLSNVLRIYSANLEDNNKAELLNALKANTSTPVIELSFDGRRLEPLTESKKILVFNAHFVAEHVYDGSLAKIKKFKGGVVTSEHLKNPQIKKIEDDIIRTTKQLSENAEERSQLSQLATDCKNELSTKWNNSITGHRLPTKLNLDDPESVPKQVDATSLDQLENDISEHYRKFAVAKNNVDIQKDVDAVNAMAFADLDVKHDVSALLTKKVSEKALEKVKNKLSKFKEVHLPHASLQDWFEDGVTLLEHSKNKHTCPLCDSSIPQIEDIISDYKEFFNEEFTALQSDLNEVGKTFESLFSDVETVNRDVVLLDKLIGKYSIRDKLSDAQRATLVDFDVAGIKDSLRDVASLVARKQKNSAITFTDGDLAMVTACSTIIKSFNSTMSNIRTIKATIQTELKKSTFSLEAAKNTAKDLFWTRLEGKLRARAKQYKGKGKGSISESSGLAFYHALNKEKFEIESEISKLQAKRSSLLARLKKESEFVNSFLARLCISNFTIRIPEADDEEIEVLYKSSSPKKGLRYSLSEGEKTALAFAYFLSKTKYEVIDNTQEQLSEHIVVIDDPVSSLDENRLYSTAMMIKQMFLKQVEQLFILSHNLVFLKFMGNILDNDDNKVREDCYLEGGQIMRLPKALTNYQTAYFYKFKRIQDYISGTLDYEAAKDIIPNCIRIVLESFLSFKLCRLKHGSGAGHKYQSAGLDRLIPAIDGLNLSSFTGVDRISNKEDLISTLWSIKNKVDPESHGTPQDVTDFEFLSESELKTVAQNTMNVIDFMDQIHMQQVQQILN